MEKSKNENNEGYIRKDTPIGPIYYKIDKSLPTFDDHPYFVKKAEDNIKWLKEIGFEFEELPSKK